MKMKKIQRNYFLQCPYKKFALVSTLSMLSVCIQYNIPPLPFQNVKHLELYCNQDFNQFLQAKILNFSNVITLHFYVWHTIDDITLIILLSQCPNIEAFQIETELKLEYGK
eukprot:397098_1